VGVSGVLGVVHEMLTQNRVVVENRGIAFGLMAGENGGLVLVLGMLMLGIVGRLSNRLGWRLMLVGGVINYFDRYRFGYVRDYWSLFGGRIYNNINDWLVAVGVVVLICELWQKRE